MKTLIAGFVFALTSVVALSDDLDPIRRPLKEPAVFERFEVPGSTGSVVKTVVTVGEPMLLQSFREDWTSTSGVGGVRLGARLVGSAPEVGMPATYPGSLENGDLWLCEAGEWEISVWSEAEDRSQGIDFELLYVGWPNPPVSAFSPVRTGRTAYHMELVSDVWNQQMKLEQRLIVGSAGTLQAYNGAVRYRWGGPPQGDIHSEAYAYNVLQPGEVLVVDPMPLASLWVRADSPQDQDVRINWMTQRLR